MPMKSSILYKRYAKALLSLALENNILERSYHDMQIVHQIFSTHNELKILLKSPIIRVGKKQSVLKHLFSTVVHPLILTYLSIIVRKQRGHMLDRISKAYLTVYKQYLGIETLKITTAVPLNDQIRNKALRAARELTPHEIEFEEEIDPEIIGGFILDLEDKQYNASVHYRLVRLKKHLMLD